MNNGSRSESVLNSLLLQQRRGAQSLKSVVLCWKFVGERRGTLCENVEDLRGGGECEGGHVI